MSSAIAAVLTPRDTPHNLPTCALQLPDAHRDAPRRATPSTERNDGRAVFGARGEQLRAVVRRRVDGALDAPALALAPIDMSGVIVRE